MIKRPVLSDLRPDFHDIVEQFKQQLINNGTNRQGALAWKDFMLTSAGREILEAVAGVGELSQYAIHRAFEEMFRETALLESSVMGSMRTNGVNLKRNSPPFVELRLPDSSNVDLPIGVVSPDPTDIEFSRQWYNNPYFDAEIFDINQNSKGQTFEFWGYGKLKRLATNFTGATSIPPYSNFSTSEGNFFNRFSLSFSNIGNVNNPRSHGWYAYRSEGAEQKPARLYRGDIVDRVYSATGNNWFNLTSAEDKFTVSNDDSTVWVENDLMTVTTDGLWGYLDDFTVVQEQTTSKGYAQILFGNDNYGKKPSRDQVVRWRYVVTKGLADNVSVFKRPNVSSTFYDIDDVIDTLVTPTIGGANYISAEEYRLIGGAIVSSDGAQRGVTGQDYKGVAKAYSQSIIDVQVDSQRTLNPGNPKWMNLFRVVTYPKLSNSEYTDLFDYMSKKTMFASNFYTEKENPIDPASPPALPFLRRLSVRANIYCIGQVDFISIRDDYVTPAIRKLLDLNGEPSVGKLNYNVRYDDLLSAIKNSHSSIDYVELLEPSTDIIGNLISPTVSRISTLSAGLTQLFEYAVVMKITNEGSSDFIMTNINTAGLLTNSDSNAGSLRIHFRPVANFDYSDTARQPTQSHKYLNNVHYALVKRNISVGGFGFASDWIPESTLFANIQPDKTVYIDDLTPNGAHVTPSTNPTSISPINQLLPTVPVLVNDTDPNFGKWVAETTIQVFASDRTGALNNG